MSFKCKLFILHLNYFNNLYFFKAYHITIIISSNNV